MKSRTVAIRVAGETWRVPSGFGRAYARFARDELDLARQGRAGDGHQMVADLLAIVGYAATVDQVAGWDLRRRVEASIYAATEHARASDNPVRRHPRPAWLPERPWQGPWSGAGALAGPTGTSISTEGARA